MKSRAAWFLVVGANLAAACGFSTADASCGAAMCVLDSRGPESSSRRFSFEIGYQVVDQDEVRIGTRRGAVGEIPSHHNEIESRTEAWMFSARAGVNDWLSFSASMPYIERIHRHEHEHHPGFYEEQEWDFAGVGDLMVMSYLTPKWMGAESPYSIAFQVGLKAPTGRANVAEVAGEQPEPMARPGSGSVDALAGVQLRRSFDTPSLQSEVFPVPFSVGVVGRINGSGTDDYRAGNDLQLNLAGGWALTSQARLLGQVNSRWRAKDEAGQTGEEESNTGGTAVFATPGLAVTIGPATAYSYVQLRIYERVNGIQITAPYHLMFGMGYGF